MRAVRVVGGGPAGVMAALAAMREGAPVRIFEKSAFPRHKVCGEFLSPAILPLLRRACCGAAFLALRPAVLRFDATPLRHARYPPSAARIRLRPQPLRTQPPPPRTRRKRRHGSGPRNLVRRRTG